VPDKVAMPMAPVRVSMVVVMMMMVAVVEVAFLCGRSTT
jgi:hypothetical protein